MRNKAIFMVKIKPQGSNSFSYSCFFADSFGAAGYVAGNFLTDRFYHANKKIILTNLRKLKIDEGYSFRSLLGVQFRIVKVELQKAKGY